MENCVYHTYDMKTWNTEKQIIISNKSFTKQYETRSNTVTHDLMHHSPKQNLFVKNNKNHSEL